MEKKKFYLITGIVLFAALTRLIPHSFNFTAIGSVALLGGALFNSKKWAFAVPFAALFISDMILNFVLYPQYTTGFFYPGMLSVYLAFGLTVLLGVFIKKPGFGNLTAASVGATALFFLITNFGSWMTMPQFYTRDINGLMNAYAAGLPFLYNNLAGNLIFTVVLFAVYQKATEQMAVSVQ